MWNGQRMAVDAISNTLTQYETVLASSGTAYDFDFPFNGVAAEVGVVLTHKTTGVDTPVSAFTLTLVSNGFDYYGVIYLTAPPASPENYRLTIYRKTALSQALDTGYNQSLNLQLMEDALDRLTRIAQDLRYGQKSLRFPVTEKIANLTQLPAAEARANSIIYFGDDGEMEVITLTELAALLAAL